MVIDFLALALGPKHCDLDLKDFRSGRSLGRVQFDVQIKQIQTMEVALYDLQCKLNGKEERAILS